MDLSLISIEDLANEIFNRCEDALIVTNRIEDNKEPIVWVRYKNGSSSACGLAEIAKEFCIRKTLGDT